MQRPADRPFYTEFAWAFDLIIDRPVRKDCAAITDWLIERGVRPGASLLDAGCGTGRYSIELARRGYVVDGIDRSPELIDVARRSTPRGLGSVSFAVQDFAIQQGVPKRRLGHSQQPASAFTTPNSQSSLSPTTAAGHYDAILCRGVLNDILEAAERAAAFEKFADLLRPNGVLILDVRDWEASAARKIREPLFRKRVSTDRGELTFTSITTLDRDHRRLLVAEEHLLSQRGRERKVTHQFMMRCWTASELRSLLAHFGFESMASFGAYDPSIDVGATDRLVVVTQRARLVRKLEQEVSFR